MPPDPADLLAQARRELGLTRQLKVIRREEPHPSRGGSRGYPMYQRLDELERWENNERTTASRASLYRWSDRIERYRQTGNHDRTQVVGADQLLLALYLIAYPDVTAEEMAAFLQSEGAIEYSTQSLSMRLAELQITKKKASIEAYQAQNEDVQFRVWAFWNCFRPLGVRGTPQRMLIDVDEFGITLERANHKNGWASKMYRVRKDGHYQHGEKITVLFAIEAGDPNLPADVYGSVAHPR
jgi:transposase